MKTIRWIVILLLSVTVLTGQSYEEDCPHIPGSNLLDVLYQNGSIYQARSNFYGYSIYKTASDGTKTQIHSSNYRSKYGKFIISGPNSWDIVMPDVNDTDKPSDEIHVISKDSLDNISTQKYTESNPSNDYFGTILDVDRFYNTFVVLGTSGFARLRNEGSSTQDSFTYSILDTDRIGLAYRPEKLELFSWSNESIYIFANSSPLFTFNDEIKDVFLDEDYSYVLFSDKVIKMNPLLDQSLDTLYLPTWVGPATKLEVDEDFFFIVHNKTLDKVVRYKKEDTSLYGILYEETSSDHFIEELRVNEDRVMTITDFLLDFYHIQDKKIVLELDKRRDLELEVLESEFTIDDNKTLTGPVMFSIYNSGSNAINLTTIFTGGNYIYDSVSRYTKTVNGPLLPGESMIVLDTLNEPFFISNNLTFYIAAADRQPLRSGAIVEVDFTSSTETIINQQFSLYPNPLDNQNNNLSFDIPFAKSLIKIYDTHARLVFSEQLFEKEGTLDLVGLTPGLYFVSIHNGEQILTERLVVH